MDQENFEDMQNTEDCRESVVDRRLGLDRRGRKSCNEANDKDQLLSGEDCPGSDGAQEGSNFVKRLPSEDRRKNVVEKRLEMNRHRGPGRRRSDERKSAEEGQMTDEQFEFLMAIDEYKRTNARPFPTWTEVLEVITALGYRKVAEAQPLASFKKDQKEEPAMN